jgi:DNA ligase-1
LVVDAEGRPLPFQVTASRAMSVAGAGLTPWWFDVLHLDGRDLLDEPLSVRAEALAAVVPEVQRAPRLITSSSEDAARFAADALVKGHEGVVLKAVDAPYESGRRGGAWLKVKPRHTLDLVVLAVEHGHGRRRGWLSNLHLGARHGDGFVMLGKTFKGLTDELLRWQTARFRELEVSDDGWVVTVRPEQVVEVAFDGVQTSTRYPGGVALRFARVLRYRDDKTAAEADTMADVLRLSR